MNLPPHLLKMQMKTQPPANATNTETSKIQKPSSKNNIAKGEIKRIRKIKNYKLVKRKWKIVRNAGGEIWEDHTLEEWPENDYRIFCGDLGNEVTDEILSTAFRKYSSFNKARVVRDKRTGKSKGYGFVSIRDASDYIKAMREMNGKYVGNRPIRLKRSTWKERCLINSNSKIENSKFIKNKRKIRKKIQLLNPETIQNPYLLNGMINSQKGYTTQMNMGSGINQSQYIHNQH
jgi:RNA recognition motif-containing protein